MNKLLAVACLAVLLAAATAGAMDFSRFDAGPNQVGINATGKIDIGDDAKLHQVTGRLSAGDRISVMALDSHGGKVLEAERLANTIHSAGLTVIVRHGDTCASACFLMLAAGTKKYVSDHARVGVHSVSVDGEETLIAQAVTTVLARKAAQYGVPPSIIGKLVTTLPDAMSWLKAADLVAMDVEIVETIAAAPAPSYQAESGRPTGSAPSTISAPTAFNPTAMFAQGLVDRGKYEAWFAGLDPLRQGGAEYWAENRSRMLKGERVTCEGSSGYSPAWTEGCSEARRLLAPADRRRLAEPDYRAGWNSL